MKYSKEDVMDFVQQEDVSFVRLAFCDVFGHQKNVSIMSTELDRAFESGISFDASSVSGFGDEKKSDLFLFPDPDTLSILPWRPSHGRVIRLFCNIKYPDGNPFEMDGRYILERAVNAAKEKGISCNFGAEFEFYLFKTDSEGEPTKIPHDSAGYMDIAPADRGVNVRREICLALAEMGISPESSHHEDGPGQHEIDFKYSTAFSAADDATTFKSVVSSIAEQNGLFACFDAKPLEEYSGNGLHINMSPVCDDGVDRTKQFLAGILSHTKEITAFLNPTSESYRRFGTMKAPKYVTWSHENRSQLVRIPAATGKYRRIELRSPDPTTNPYIAYALLIYAGLDGIENELTPPSPTDVNLFTAPPDELVRYEALPLTLSEANAIARDSKFITSVLPKRVIDTYTMRG